MDSVLFICCKGKVLFRRDEYQNLPHKHLIYTTCTNSMSTEELDYFFEDMIRTSMFNVVKPGEVQSLIDKGFFESQREVPDVL